MKLLQRTGLACVLAMGAACAQAQVVEKKTLTLEGAKKVIAAATGEAKRVNAPGAVIAVVDDGGTLVALERLDKTFAAGSQISIGKARTAALFQRPTKAFEDVIKNGRTSMVALPDAFFTPLQGGVPIIADGQVVGAVGVSGAVSAQQDEDLAIAGARALTNPTAHAPSEPVTYLDKDQVVAAFAKGAPLLEVDGYKVHASRREKPGLVEVHEHETDVVYVLEGTATLVTGGRPVDPKVIAPGEIRAPDVVGGEIRKLAKGDVVVIPPNTPHWFKEASNPFLYFVVKPIHKDSL
ncbi:MAG TPA: heme-binding protein [Burkholderiales bacterium]|nr:heme-binding protein [Burkholderiales bacterium]